MASLNIKATISPLIAAKQASQSRVNSPSAIRGPQGTKLFGGQLANSLAGDIESINNVVNNLQQAMQVPPQISQILLTNSAGEVVAALGNMTFKGVNYVNYLSQLSVGDPLQTRDPSKALFNANLDGSVTIGQSGWLDVYDPFGGSAAWIGTQFETTVITNAVNNGAGLIRVTAAAHGLLTGNIVQIRNLNRVNVPNGVGTFQVSVVDANTVDLVGSTWSGPWTAQAAVAGIPTYNPTIDHLFQISGAANAAGLIRITTSAAHGFETGAQVSIPSPGPGGVSAAVGEWTITVISATTFDLRGSVFAGAYTSGGTVLQYYSGGLFQTIAVGTSFSNYSLRAFASGDLRIRNATISVATAGNSIVIDPATASILLTSATTTIRLDASTGQIVMSEVTNLAKIVIDASVPNIKLFDALGAVSAVIDAATGAIVANSVSSTAGFSGAVVVRNSAGTGVSTLTVVGGLITAYVP